MFEVFDSKLKAPIPESAETDERADKSMVTINAICAERWELVSVSREQEFKG
jgi:hypothetical protein